MRNNILNFFFAVCTGGENCDQERELPAKHSWNQTPALTNTGKTHLGSPTFIGWLLQHHKPMSESIWRLKVLQRHSWKVNSSHFEIFLLQAALKRHLQSRVFKKQQELKTFGVDNGSPSSAALKVAFKQKQDRKLRRSGQSRCHWITLSPGWALPQTPQVQIPELWSEKWERED